MSEVVTPEIVPRLAVQAASRITPRGLYTREDVIQECALYLLRYMVGYSAGAAVGYCRHGVIARLGMQYRTRDKGVAKPRLEQAECFDAADSRDDLRDLADREEVAWLLEHISPLQREAVERHLSGLDTVRQRYDKALRSLRRRFGGGR